MDDVQNTTQLEFDEGALLRKEMGLITPSELATALGVSEVTLQVWRQKGNGPRFTKLGKNIFYPLREVQKWTETNVLDRVNTSVQSEAPLAHYKSGKIVEIFDVTPQQTQTHGDPSSAEEIDKTLTKLIGHEDD
jgi:predicted DNA-binding transcriptional regulator AlpA